MNITVYCSSSNNCNPSYLTAAEATGTWIATHGHTLVYGGSNTGLMGAVSVSAADAGGTVIGVVPDVPLISKRKSSVLTETVYTSSMAERKVKMMELANAFIVFPGGPGTIDELTEILCEKSLHLANKPIILFDVEGFWDCFVSWLDVMIQNGVAQPSIHGLYKVVHNIAELENALI